MELQSQSIRNVGNKEIYDSYMGILRISPNMVGEERVDDTTTLLKTLKSGEKDNKIILSDSSGNMLGIYFVPRVRKTLVVNEIASREVRDVINFVIKTDDSYFISKTYTIKSTLFIDNTKENEYSVRPLQVISQPNKLNEKFDVVTYPIESPHSEDYFNNKNKHNLVDYEKSDPLNEQLIESLKSKSPQWYIDNIDSKYKVKVNDDFILTTNKDGERIPVLYTHDYVLGHYSGHTARLTEDLKTKYLGNTIALKKLDNGTSLFSKLSYMRVDDFIWSRLTSILSGEKRHERGRYTKLGLSKNESLTEYLFGIIAPNLTESAPLLGTSLPFGGLSYNAISFKRFLFNCLRQEVRNRKDIENNGGEPVPQTLQEWVDNGLITGAKQKEEGFSSQMAQNYILCDGKEVTLENYPHPYPDNKSLYLVDENGFATRDENGLPQFNTNNPIIQAIQNSNRDNKFKTPSLFSFEMSTMRFLRGLNWNTTINKDVPVDLDKDIKEGMFSQNNSDIEIVEGSDYAVAKKNFWSVGNYRVMYDFKLVNTKHRHYCFSSVSGEPVSNGGDPMYPWKSMSSHMIYGNYMSVNTGSSFWRDLFTYSFTDKRSTIGGKLQSQALLYGCQPVRIAGKFAWRVKEDGSLTDNFEENVEKGEYFINDADLTPVSYDKEERKKQLLHMDKAESVAPVSVIGHSGLLYECTSRSFKCRPRIRWHHETVTICKYRGAYSVMRSTGGTPRCVTSTPISNTEVTDKEYNSETKKDVSFSGTTVSMDMSLPSPPALSFLPLMKIR